MDPVYVLSEQQAWAIGAAVFFMVFDIVSGFLAAVVNQEVSSSKMRVGLGHKMVLLLMIALALGIEVFSLHVSGLGFGGVTVTAVCAFIVVMEVASILENLRKAYPDIDGWAIMKIFENSAAGEKKEV